MILQRYEIFANYARINLCLFMKNVDAPRHIFTFSFTQYMLPAVVCLLRNL